MRGQVGFSGEDLDSRDSERRHTYKKGYVSNYTPVVVTRHEWLHRLQGHRSRNKVLFSMGKSIRICTYQFSDAYFFAYVRIYSVKA